MVLVKSVLGLITEKLQKFLPLPACHGWVGEDYLQQRVVLQTHLGVIIKRDDNDARGRSENPYIQLYMVGVSQATHKVIMSTQFLLFFNPATTAQNRREPKHIYGFKKLTARHAITLFFIHSRNLLLTFSCPHARRHSQLFRGDGAVSIAITN